MPKLVGVVAYYPGHAPRSNTDFPLTLHVQIHLAASQKWGTRFPSYRYENTEPGFAEHDLDEFDKIGAALAWTRTLTLLRNAFGIDSPDLEAIWDNHTRLEFAEKDADKTMATMVPQPYVNHVPTMTGGIGYDQLRRFYNDFFIPQNPPDMRLRLLSRTVGADRVVDEMLISFTHTTDIPWMLPGIPPTGKRVDVILVSVVCIRGGKLYHEHIHWDQATVLVQVGLLDPKYIPDSFKTTEKGKEKDVKRLPVCGNEAAKKVLDESSAESNDLIPDW
jgi:predicted ester cyclase